MIVEDDHRLAASMRRGLEDAGFATDGVFDGEEAVGVALATSYDVILLDVMLPNTDGIEVSRQPRSRPMHAPILMLALCRADPKGVRDPGVLHAQPGAA